MLEDHSDRTCSVDDETIERYVLGRVTDASVLAHMDTCASCLARAAEHRAYLATLKSALKGYQKTDPGADRKKDEAGSSPKPPEDE